MSSITGVLPPRNKSQRIMARKEKEAIAQKQQSKRVIPTIHNPQPANVCLGLNEFTDTLNAFPRGIISYFTLLKEIEAKCVYTIPHLQAYIRRFLEMKNNHPKRGKLLARIRECIQEIMPCLEEKMHVATIASDQVKKYVKKLDDSFEIIANVEIPEIIRIGPMWEPCMKVSEPKTLQQQRSESRREALAAKKAKNGDDESDSMTGAEDSSGPSLSSSKKKAKKDRTTQNAFIPVTTPSSSSKKRKAENEIYQQNSGVNNKTANNNNILDISQAKKNKTTKRKDTKKESDALKSNGNGQDATSRSQRAKKEEKEYTAYSPITEAEPVYCYCQQVSYGEMVGCDGENCEKEWFHLPCTGLKELPKGEWFCDDCKANM